MILRKLKRLLGLGADEDGSRSERDVTVQGRDEADAESEAAVKGVDESDGEADESIEDGASDDPVAAGTDADASTESLVDEDIAQEEASSRAEPAEAAGQESDEDDDSEPESPDVDIDDAETDDADDSPPVDEIRGIGPAYSDRLAEIGIETVADLRGADAEEVAERTTAPEGTVRKWMDRADED